MASRAWTHVRLEVSQAGEGVFLNSPSRVTACQMADGRRYLKRAGLRTRRLRSRSGLRAGGVELTEMPEGGSFRGADSDPRVFYSSEMEKLAKKSRRRGKRRRIRVARIRVTQSADKVILSWQVISISGRAVRKLRKKLGKLAEEERDGAIDAIADTLGEPLWEPLAGGWDPIDPGDFGALAEAVSALQGKLKSYLLGDPAKSAGSALGLADLSVLEAIAERVSLPGIDRSLGDIRHYAEIAGIILVVLTGGHLLACASFKLWVHDKLGQLLAKLLDKFLRELGASPVGRPSSAEAGSRRPGPPGGPGEPPHKPPPDTPHDRDDPDRSPPGSGPPPVPSRGFPDRSHPPADSGPARPDPSARPAPAAAPRQPVTVGEMPTPATPGSPARARTRLHGPSVKLEQREQDRAQPGGRAAAGPAKVRQREAGAQREAPPSPMSTPSELDTDRADAGTSRGQAGAGRAARRRPAVPRAQPAGGRPQREPHPPALRQAAEVRERREDDATPAIPRGRTTREASAAGRPSAARKPGRTDGNEPRRERHYHAIPATGVRERREDDATPAIPRGRTTREAGAAGRPDPHDVDKPRGERYGPATRATRARELPADRGADLGRAEARDALEDPTTGMGRSYGPSR